VLWWERRRKSAYSSRQMNKWLLDLVFWNSARCWTGRTTLRSASDRSCISDERGPLKLSEDLFFLTPFCLDRFYLFLSYQNSSSTANAVLEAARKNNSPIIIQVSNGGGAFMAGKGLKDARPEGYIFYSN